MPNFFICRRGRSGASSAVCRISQRVQNFLPCRFKAGSFGRTKKKSSVDRGGIDRWRASNTQLNWLSNRESPLSISFFVLEISRKKDRFLRTFLPSSGVRLPFDRGRSSRARSFSRGPPSIPIRVSGPWPSPLKIRDVFSKGPPQKHKSLIFPSLAGSEGVSFRKPRRASCHGSKSENPVPLAVLVLALHGVKDSKSRAPGGGKWKLSGSIVGPLERGRPWVSLASRSFSWL